jgi:phospholipase D1/2
MELIWRLLVQRRQATLLGEYRRATPRTPSLPEHCVAALTLPSSSFALLCARRYWQFRSICRGGNSLIEKLIANDVDPNEYIKFVGLRTHDKLKSGWQTEQVYIHSKLMIVDDHTTIIGSANLNDRSMLGNKDTEICILTEDTQMTDSLMNGNSFQAGRFSKSLRMQCWAEFCGLDLRKKADYDLISDPVHDNTWRFILDLARSNTEK